MTREAAEKALAERITDAWGDDSEWPRAQVAARIACDAIEKVWYLAPNGPRNGIPPWHILEEK